MRTSARFGVLLLSASLCLPVWAARNFVDSGSSGDVAGSSDIPIANSATAPALDIPAAQPRMAPELALQKYLERAQRQLADLGAYSDETTIEAELPSTSQRGSFVLKRVFFAPRMLVFKAIKFTGDGFVKTNVITRLLQSEVDRAQKDEGRSVAILPENYKFSYKGTEVIDGKTVHLFNVKPRKKRIGLFKGKIYLDVHSGALLRAEGQIVKSPSFFIKKINFVQDYDQIGPFSLPAHIHSIADTRIVGRAIVDIYHRNYDAKALSDLQQPAGSSSGTAVPAAPTGSN